MKKVFVIFSIFLAVLALPAYLLAGADNYISVISSDSGGITLEIRVPEPHFEEVLEGGNLYHKVTILDFGTTTEVGSPQLPQIGTLLGIPEGGTPTLEVLEADSSLLSRYNILPVHKPVIIEEDGPGRLEFEFAIDREAYSFNGFIPVSVAKIDFAGFMRDQKVVRLLFFPIQFNPIRGELQYYSRIKVKLNYNTQVVGKGIKKSSIQGTNNAYEKLLENLLLNYDGMER